MHPWSACTQHDITTPDGSFSDRAISKGSMGAGLVMADLGSAENCEKEGAPVLQYRQVPAEFLPAPTDFKKTQGPTVPYQTRKKSCSLMP